MVTQIHGQRADDNDNDPVEVRHFEILGSGLDQIIGFPTSVIWYEWLVGTGYRFWQYFEHGIIVAGPDTCACVLYGPIYEYWAAQGQFQGPLGCPATDVLRVSGPAQVPGSPPPPPQPAYAVFEGGVLFLDTPIGSSVEELSPLAPGLVKGGAGIEPTGDGVAQAAQKVIQDQANQALATNQRLKDNVRSITPHVRFERIGPGGCSGAGFNSVGRTMLHSHVLGIHFDIELSGCAGSIGSASADATVEVRIDVSPPNVTARMVSHHIDAVSSPFGAGDNDIRDGLAGQLIAQYGHNLLTSTVPSGITILGAIVRPNGDIDLYMEPICSTTAMIAKGSGEAGAKTLSHLRRLRDGYIKRAPHGADFIQIVDAIGPVLVATLREQRDANELRARIERFLVATFGKNPDLPVIGEKIIDPAERIIRLIDAAAETTDRDWLPRVAGRSVDLVRDYVHGKEADLDALLDALNRAVDEETRLIGHESNRRDHPPRGD